MRKLLVAIIGLVLVCAGCATTTAGTPAPAQGASSPSRPREIRLDGLDACELFTPAVRAALRVRRDEPYGAVTPSALYGGDVRRCVTGRSGEVSRSIGVSVVTIAGIERLRDPSLRMSASPRKIAGFPALVFRTAEQRTCRVAVDVHPGQLIELWIDNSRPETPISQDDLCEEGVRDAEVVVGALLRR